MHQFHIVMNPFNNRSQMIAKCGKDKKCGSQGVEGVTDVLTTL